MKIVFMGTPDFAVPTLEALIRGGHQVAAVVTQPDKPKGRGKAVQSIWLLSIPLRHWCRRLSWTVRWGMQMSACRPV